MIRLRCSKPTPAGLLAPDQLQCSNVALGMCKAKAPTTGLSALNSIAFGLAVRRMVGFAEVVTFPRRKARFQLLVRLYWTGFSPARFR